MKNRKMQMDLFAVTLPARQVDTDQRNKLLPLIEELLKEVTMDAPATAREGSDDKNHV